MKSSTQTILEHTSVPKHIAVIMDGNGRWAKRRFLPRVMGHKRGLDALEEMVKNCAQAGVEYLTVFAFSTENWRRPEDEVSFLMGLFLQALQKQVQRLHENNMRLKVIGSRERFSTDSFTLQTFHGDASTTHTKLLNSTRKSMSLFSTSMKKRNASHSA